MGTAELAVRSETDLRWRTGDTIYECLSIVSTKLTSQAVVVDQQLHTHDERPHAKISRYVTLVHLISRLEADAEVDGGCQRFFDRDPCEGAMVLWWVFGMGTSVASSRCVSSFGYQTYV